MAIFGFLVMNKPPGVTSRWVVDQVQKLVRPDKVGHAGTLDPLATGVLVVAIGSATRLVEYVQAQPKRYVGTFLLGRTSPTEDTDGLVTELADAPIPTLDALRKTAASMLGVLRQTPPDYSAVHVEGKRAYELAREGKSFTLEPRRIETYRFDVIEYDYPRLVLDIECSGGTYVRTLGRELAERLGTGAVMSALKRLSIGEFRLEASHTVEQINRQTIGGLLLDPVSALTHLPRVPVNPTECARLIAGLKVTVSSEGFDAEGEVAVVDECQKLVAIAMSQCVPLGHELRPTKVFATRDAVPTPAPPPMG